MIIIPLQDYVLLKEKKANEIIKSQILVSETVDMEYPPLAEVLECGSYIGQHIDNTSSSSGNFIPVGLDYGFKNGDTVLFQRHLFEKYTFDGKEYLFGKAQGIIAVINEHDVKKV